MTNSLILYIFIIEKFNKNGKKQIVKTRLQRGCFVINYNVKIDKNSCDINNEMITYIVYN